MKTDRGILGDLRRAILRGYRFSLLISDVEELSLYVPVFHFDPELSSLNRVALNHVNSPSGVEAPSFIHPTFVFYVSLKCYLNSLVG